jgi:hypothetical protein
MSDQSNLIFVGGLHRSGTTPLARALAEHPEISGLTDTGMREDEGQHLQRAYPKAKTYGGSGRFAFDDRAHLTEHSPLATPETAEALRQAWDPYWDLSRRYLLEKSPPNLIMGRFLQTVFPGSSLIVVIRHPVVVALSNKKWRKLLSSDPRKFQSVSSLVSHWVHAHRLLVGDMPHLERLHIVHYEDLVADPHRELGKVQDFLGLASPVPTSSLRSSASSQYEQWWSDWSSWWRPGHVQRTLIETRHGHDLGAFGYELEDLSVHREWHQLV